MKSFFVVIAATNNSTVNNQIYHEAVENNQLINCVDDPEHCNFYLSAIVNRKNLQIAISTAGKSPLFAKAFKKVLEEKLPDTISDELERFYAIRQQIITHAGTNEVLKKQLMDEQLVPLIHELIKKIK